MVSVHNSAREKRTDTNCSMPNGEIDGKQHYSVWIGAKTEHALQFVEHYIITSKRAGSTSPYWV